MTLQRIGRVYGWNERPLASITDDDAAAMLHDIADRRGKKSMANQTKHILHAMFKWAKQPGRKFVTVNPFADLPAPGGAKVTARPLPDRRRNPAGLARARRAGTVRRVARCRDRAAPDPGDGGAAGHGARHGRQRASRPARAERARSALVAARRADEGGQRVHHAAVGLGARTAAAASQGRSGRAAVRPASATTCTKRRSASLPGSRWSDGRRTTFGAPPRRSSTGRATRWSRSARCWRTPARA